MPSIREIAKTVLPSPAVRFLRKQLRERGEKNYAAQRLTSFHWGGFELEIPQSHPLRDCLKDAPLRDQFIVEAATSVLAKYPEASFLDIGANIGDTAALLASCTRNRLILVEASDYFFPILSRNARLFPNETILVQALVGDGSNAAGDFMHWGGTASFVEDGVGDKRVRSVQLVDVADAQTRFVKTDTDGFDFRILSASLDWLAQAKPAIVFENQIRTARDLTHADALFDALSRIGYTGFVVWDDTGFRILSTGDVRVLKNLDYYLFEIWHRPVPKRISNYDVLCLHQDDADIFERIRDRTQ